MRSGCSRAPHLESYNERIELDGEPVSDADFALALEAVLRAAYEVRPDGPIGTQAGSRSSSCSLRPRCGSSASARSRSPFSRWGSAVAGTPRASSTPERRSHHRRRARPHCDPRRDTRGHRRREGRHHPACERAGARPRHRRPRFDLPARVRDGRCQRPRRAGGPRLLAGPRGAHRPLPRRGAASSPDGYTLVSVDGVHAHYPALALSGPAYQAANIATAVAAAEAALGRALHVERARAALRALTLPGRFELVREVAAGHRRRLAQPAGRRGARSRDSRRVPRPAARPLVLLGMLADKDARGIIEALAPVAGAIAATQSDSPRAMAAEALAALVAEVTGTPPAGVFASVAEALDGAAARRVRRPRRHRQHHHRGRGEGAPCATT